MAGTEIANAYVALQVKMPGVNNDISKALGGSDVSSVVNNQGKAWGSVLTGAVAGAAAAGVSKAISLVTGSIDAAIKRVDTLNNFPKIMSNLGYSADDAQKSIDRISKGLEGLPTTLDGMAGAVQQLAPLTGSLSDATDLSLALNNALLAGGKSTDIQSNAMDQYVQMLAVGKVDMTAWRSIVSAMPGQVDQLSKSLLGAGSGQNDLYTAMANGTITFDQFNDAILDLDKNGTGSFASFADQAKSATDGIATSQANLNTAITRGMANLIQKFQPAITVLLGAITSLASGGFGFLAEAIDWMAQNTGVMIPVISGLAAAILVSLAPALWAAVTATWAWTAALLANPFTWIVLGIAALVAGIVWLATETTFFQDIWANFTKFLGEAWANITGFFTSAWEDVIQPVFQKIGEIATWLYENILKPVFDGIGAVVGFVAGVIKFHFDLIVNAFRFFGAVANWLWITALQPTFNAIGALVTWLYETIISPVFAAIGAVFQWVWATVIQPVINYINSAIAGMGIIFEWLYKNIVKPVWEGISGAMKASWDWINAYVFAPFKVGIDLIGQAFSNVAKFIGGAWNEIKKAAAAPINFVLDTVWNNGLRSFWNDMVSELGIAGMKLPPAPLVKFASGGVMPGYTPGRDVHEFFSPTGGRLALSGGEAIMRPEFTRLVGGAAGVDALNAAARSGSLPMGDGMGSFAGDAWDAITKAASVAWDFISNPAQAIKSHVIDGIIRPMVGDQNIFGKTVGGLAEKTLLGFVDLFKTAAPMGQGTKGMGWESMWKMVQGAIPGAVMTSNLRPGAKTVNGGQSYHASGRAIDLVPASMAMFDAVAKLFPNASELIYTPAGNRQLQNGKPFAGWSEAVKKQHYNHVHLAMANGGVVPKLYDQGGWLPHGGMGLNMTGKPEAVLTPDESVALRNGLRSGGLTFNVDLKSDDPRLAVRQMGREAERLLAAI